MITTTTTIPPKKFVEVMSLWICAITRQLRNRINQGSFLQSTHQTTPRTLSVSAAFVTDLASAALNTSLDETRFLQRF